MNIPKSFSQTTRRRARGLVVAVGHEPRDFLLKSLLLGRDFLAGHDLESDFAQLDALRAELDAALGQLTENAAAQEALTKQSQVQTIEIRRLRSTLRNAQLKPIVLMSRTMNLEINGTGITFTLPNHTANGEVLAAASDAMVNALEVLGPHFVARGFAANFVEQMRATTKAFRAAIDERSSQVARRVGITAALDRDAIHLTRLVRVIDTLIRPVIQSNAELLAAWENVVALPRSSKSKAETSAGTPSLVATSDAASGGTRQGQLAVA